MRYFLWQSVMCVTCFLFCFLQLSDWWPVTQRVFYRSLCALLEIGLPLHWVLVTLVHLLLYASFHDITLLIVLLKGIKIKGAGENILWQSVHANKEIRTSLRYSLTPYRFHFTWFTWPFCTLKTQCSAPNWLFFFKKQPFNKTLTKPVISLTICMNNQ